MPTIVVQNYNPVAFGLQVEPWAMYEQIAPGARAEITFDDLDRPIEFTITKDGAAFVGIMSDITFTVDGRVIFNSREST